MVPGHAYSASRSCDKISVPTHHFAGLQVSPDPRLGETKEVVNDIDGLEKYPVTDTEAQIGELDDSSQVNILPPTKVAVFAGKRRPILLIAGGVVIIAIAAIIAGVLGSRAARNSATDGTRTATAPIFTEDTSNSNSIGVPHTNDVNNTTSDVRFTASGRIKSEIGTWNGTGLAATAFSQQDQSDNELIGLVFQDYAGQVHSLALQYDSGTSKMDVISSVFIPIEAAQGSTLASTLTTKSDNKTSGLVLTYVNSDGVLSDIWQDNPPFGDFKRGMLDELGVKVPTDNRAAAGFFTNIPGEEVLVTGQEDNKLHSYSLGVTNRTWSPYATWNFTFSWAYGGLAASSYPDPSATHLDRTLYHSTEDGILRQYNQSGTFTDNPGYKPGQVIQLQGSKVLEQPVMVNTSLALAFNNQPGSDPWMIFPTMESRLGVRSFTYTRQGDYSSALESFGVLQGSDVHSVYVASKNYNVLFYQDEGSSIAWMAVIAGFGKQAAGHLTTTGNYPNGSQIWASKSSNLGERMFTSNTN